MWVVNSHNPYFNRWFSAIEDTDFPNESYTGHNPYFNRWFSAIYNKGEIKLNRIRVTILILIDGFLQYSEKDMIISIKKESQSLF